MRERIRPLVVFDGECGFCRRRVERWRQRTGDAVEYQASAGVAADLPEIGAEAFAHSVQYVATDGSVADGADAVLRTLAHGGPGGRALLGLYRRLPGFAPLAERAYRSVADRRQAVSKLDRAWFGDEPACSSFRLSTALFLRLLGLVYLIAFGSLLVQVRGLVGESGILPVANLLGVAERWAEAEGRSAFSALPTLSWLSPSDALLVAQCALGMVLGLALTVGLASAWALILAWPLYLSVVVAGDVFTSFQWDALLLETGLLAIFLAPWRLRAPFAAAPDPPRLARWLAWLLVARLMIFSGVVKLASGGGANSWLDLSALTHHWQTQPLPTPLAWWAHQLPLAVQRVLCVGMFAIELGAPLLLLFGRRARLLGATALLGLQVAIALTGNYGYFNLLTAALCLLLVDDRALARLLPGGRRALAAEPRGDRRVAKAAPLLVYAVWALVLGGLHTVRLGGAALDRPAWREAGSALLAEAGTFRTVNSYGLFARMTEARFEIEIQGSDDGETWSTYRFRWKPGDPDAAPPWVAPHMPRLDWQMWFASLAGYRASPWFARLCERLLEGSPAVAGLFAENPFPDEPPRFVQARFVRYRFADRNAHRETGAWWIADDVGPFVTPQELRQR